MKSTIMIARIAVPSLLFYPWVAYSLARVVHFTSTTPRITTGTWLFLVVVILMEVLVFLAFPSWVAWNLLCSKSPNLACFSIKGRCVFVACSISVYAACGPVGLQYITESWVPPHGYALAPFLYIACDTILPISFLLQSAIVIRRLSQVTD